MVRMIDINEVIRRTGLARSTIWRRRKDRKFQFPLARQMSLRRIGWPDVKIDRWILRRPATSTRRRRRRRLVGRRQS